MCVCVTFFLYMDLNTLKSLTDTHKHHLVHERKKNERRVYRHCGIGMQLQQKKTNISFMTWNIFFMSSTYIICFSPYLQFITWIISYELQSDAVKAGAVTKHHS